MTDQQSGRVLEAAAARHRRQLLEGSLSRRDKSAPPVSSPPCSKAVRGRRFCSSMVPGRRVVEADRVVASVSHGTPVPLAPHDWPELSAGISGWVVRHRIATTSANVVTDPRNTGAALGRALERGEVSVAVAPILVGDTMLGTMTLLDEKRVLDARTLDLGLLSMMATATGLMVVGSQRTAGIRAALTTVSRRCDDAERALMDGNREIGTAAHELRNAVAGTVTAAALIHRHALDLGDPELADMADAARDAGEDAHRIVSDLLGRRPAAGGVDRSDGLTDVVAAAAGVAKLAGIDPPHGLAPMLTTADGVRLRQVIRNLVDNAMRYGGSHVWLDLAAGDGLGHVSVWDDGSGVAPELVERPFQMPVSSNQVVDGRGSHGYGLVTAGAIAHDRVAISPITGRPDVPASPSRSHSSDPSGRWWDAGVRSQGWRGAPRDVLSWRSERRWVCDVAPSLNRIQLPLVCQSLEGVAAAVCEREA